MPRTFVDLTMASSGADVVTVIGRLQNLADIHFITGEHDLYFDWNTSSEFELAVKAIHRALSATGVIYRVHTETDHGSEQPLVAWPPPLGDAPEENPAYSQRKRSKGLERIR